MIKTTSTKSIAFIFLILFAVFILTLGGIFALIISNQKSSIAKKPIDKDIIHTPTNDVGFLTSQEKAGLKVEAKLGNEKLGNSNTQVYLQINLTATDIVKEETRRPLNLSIVIDRSGSMSGGKLENVKEALRKLVDYLTSEDKVALVAYDSNVEVLFSGQFNKEAYLSKVNGIYAGSSTNLEGGLLKGLEYYIDYSLIDLAPGVYPHYQKLILLSDGLANVGRSTPDELARITKEKAQNMFVTTIGVGNDYDENIMTSIARAGKGNYYFMEDPASAKNIFEEELKRSTEIVLEDIKVEPKLDPNFEIKRGIGYQLSDKSYFEPLDMYAKKNSSYLIEINKIGDVANSDINVGNIKVTYSSRISGSIETLELPISLKFSEEKVNPLADKEMYKEYILSLMAEELWKVDQHLQKQENDAARKIIDDLLKVMNLANDRLIGEFDNQIESIENKEMFLKNLGSSYVNDSDEGKNFKKDNQNESFQRIYGK